MKRINDGRFTKTEVARRLEVLPQHVTNWLRRGIPAGRIHDVAALCDISTDEYRREAGLLSKHATPKQGRLATPALMKDFEALPDGLQAYIVRKTQELRELYEGFPTWLRDRLVPPKDVEQYRAWERDIEALMLKFRRTEGDPP